MAAPRASSFQAFDCISDFEIPTASHLEKLLLTEHLKLEEICDSFEARLASDLNPTPIESYLTQVSECSPSFQEAVIFELVRIALEHQKNEAVKELLATGKNIYSRIVAKACRRFSNSTFTSGIFSSAPSVEVRGFPDTSRFLYLCKIGSGGLGTVYEALDRTRNLHVAIKTLRNFGGATLYQFKREFRALAGIEHPNLVNLHELFQQEPHWFISMEFVDGVDAITFCEENPKNRTERARSVIKQLASGLVALHDNGKLHCDIKPENLLIKEDKTLKILDFGMVAEWRRDEDVQTGQRKGIAGTLAYMAPEQILGEKLTPAADWFAVGIVLCELLSGQRPSTEGKTVDMLLVDSPKDLRVFCKRLLASNPSERLSDNEVLAALNVEHPSNLPYKLPSNQDWFVGRKTELEQLRSHLLRTQPNHLGIMLISGGSGMGKTSLVRRFLSEARFQKEDTVVLASRCFPHESVQFPGIDGIADELATFVRTLPSELIDAKQLEGLPSLLSLFPVLNRIPNLRKASETARNLPIPDDLSERRDRAVHALRLLLTQIGSHTLPVIFIDDFQWSGADSISLLKELISFSPPPCHIVLNCRTDSAPLQKTFSDLKKSFSAIPEIIFDSIALGALKSEDTASLAKLALPDESCSSELREALIDESGGHPYFLTELALSNRSFLASGNSLPDALAARIKNLPNDTRTLLEFVSVSSIPIDVRAAFNVAQFGIFSPQLTQELEHNKLATCSDSTGLGGTIQPYHDAVRIAVLHELDSPSLSACHHRLAVHFRDLESKIEPQVTAYHFEGAGHGDEAAAYYHRAASRSSEALAFDRSANYYRKALELYSTVADDEIRKLRLGCAEALESAGRSREAAIEYEWLGLNAGNERKEEFLRRAALLNCSSGHLEIGLELLKSQLALHGLRMPRLAAGAAGTLWILQIFVLRVRLARYRPSSEKKEIDPRLAAKIDLLLSAVSSLSMIDTVGVMGLLSKASLLALRSGDPDRIGKTLAFLSAFTIAPGWRFRRYLALFDTVAKDLCTRSSDPYINGTYLLTKGILVEHLSLFSEALPILKAAEKMFATQCRHAWWELASVRTCLMWNLYFTGRLVELESMVGKFLRDAQRRDDRYFSSNVNCFSYPVVHLANDRPEKSLEAAALGLASLGDSGPGHIQRLTHTWAYTLSLLYMGKSSDALSYLDEQQYHLRSCGLLYIEFLRMWMLDVHITTLLGTAASSDVHTTKRLLRRARRKIHRLQGIKQPIAKHLSSRLEGVLHSIQQNPKQAARCLWEAKEGLLENGLLAYALCSEHLLQEIKDESSGDLRERFQICGIREPSKWRRTHMGI